MQNSNNIHYLHINHKQSGATPIADSFADHFKLGEGIQLY